MKPPLPMGGGALLGLLVLVFCVVLPAAALPDHGGVHTTTGGSEKPKKEQCSLRQETLFHGVVGYNIPGAESDYPTGRPLKTDRHPSIDHRDRYGKDRFGYMGGMRAPAVTAAGAVAIYKVLERLRKDLTSVKAFERALFKATEKAKAEAKKKCQARECKDPMGTCMSYADFKGISFAGIITPTGDPIPMGHRTIKTPTEEAIDDLTKKMKPYEDQLRDAMKRKDEKAMKEAFEKLDPLAKKRHDLIMGNTKIKPSVGPRTPSHTAGRPDPRDAGQFKVTTVYDIVCYCCGPPPRPTHRRTTTESRMPDETTSSIVEPTPNYTTAIDRATSTRRALDDSRRWSRDDRGTEVIDEPGRSIQDRVRDKTHQAIDRAATTVRRPDHSSSSTTDSSSTPVADDSGSSTATDKSGTPLIDESGTSTTTATDQTPTFKLPEPVTVYEDRSGHQETTPYDCSVKPYMGRTNRSQAQQALIDNYNANCR